MGAYFEEIPESLIPWILDQKVIWIGSAPLSGEGHVNVSPKGGGYFGVSSRRQFWYQDLTGSGNETLSHLWEPGNARITVLLNAFEGPPRIVRLWGHGKVLEYGTKEFNTFVKEHNVETIPGTRAIIIVDIHQVGTSCGFSMPFFDFKAFRPTLNEFFEKRVANEEAGNKKDGIERYWAFKNQESMDGLPGMKRALKTAKRERVEPIKKMVGPHAPSAQKKAQNRNVASDPSMMSIAITSFFLGVVVAFFLMEYARGDLIRDFAAGREMLQAIVHDLEGGR